MCLVREERNRIARNSTPSGRNFIVENVDVPSTPAEFHALKRERLDKAIRHRKRKLVSFPAVRSPARRSP